MDIHVYGKDGCKLCKSAKKKVNHFLDRWGLGDQIEVTFLDMKKDYHAAAEGDFFDVFDIPTVLVMEDESSVRARWDGQAPPSSELKEVIQAA